MKKTLYGIVHIHAETGTEGGWWAFQDGEYIGTRVEERCRKCGAWWDGDDNEPDGDRRVGDFVLRACKRGEHDVGPVEVPSWGYAGLHILKTGDFLTIYEPTALAPVVWTGEVQLKRTPMEVWHRSEQEGVELEKWRTWFAKELPAMLTLSVGKDTR